MRRRTVEGFGLTGTAFAAAVGLALSAVVRGQNGDPMWAVGAWAVAAVAAGAVAVWALRRDAQRAFGPPGSPERVRRRLGGPQLVRNLGGGTLLGVGFVVVMRYVVDRDEPAPALADILLRAALLGLAYGALFAWQAWARVDDEAAADAERIPARGVRWPAAAVPPRDPRVDRRRGVVVCALLAALGLAAAVDGVVARDWERTGFGFAMATGSLALTVLLVSPRD